MHTVGQSSTELKSASAETADDPAALRRDLGRIYRLILNYGCWKRAAAQVGAQDRLGEATAQVS